MMENGSEDKDMGTAYGKVLKETLTLENGGMEKLWVMESLAGVTVTNTKENGI